MARSCYCFRPGCPDCSRDTQIQQKPPKKQKVMGVIEDSSAKSQSKGHPQQETSSSSSSASATSACFCFRSDCSVCMRGSQRVGGSMRSSAVIPIADDEAKQTETGPGPVEQGMKRKKRVIPNDGKVKQKLAVDVAMVNAKCPLVRAAWPVPPSVGQTLTQKLNLQAGPWQFWDAWLSKLRLVFAGRQDGFVITAAQYIRHENHSNPQSNRQLF